MTKYSILIFAFLPFIIWGDCADCEAYKTQVVNDCDSILSAILDINSGAIAIDQATVYIEPSSSRDYILQQASQIEATCSVLDGFVRSIKSTAQSLQCSTNTAGACDCAPYLQSLVTLVTSAKNELEGISATLGTMQGKTVISELDLIERTNQDLVDILTEFFLWDGGDALPISIMDLYNSVTNLSNIASSIFLGKLGNETTINAFTAKYWYSNIRNVLSEAQLENGYNNASSLRNQSLNYSIKGGFSNLSKLLASLNNYSYTNMFQYSHMDSSLVSVNTNLVSLSEKFSIFNDFVFSSDAPLSMYTDIDTDGSYHDYLTNYYIKVSKGQQSGSDNFTNWFSRIEILLASLVFQDDGTNFIDEVENTTQFENTLSQSVDTLSQAVSIPQNLTGKIDNMGQSFLGLLGEWRTIVSGNSLPSQFVLCDINLPSQNRDSSSLSSFRLETSLDSGEFRQFLDFCHAITTILFTMLFVWLSIMLLSFLLASLAKLVHFCYLVYSALFGG